MYALASGGREMIAPGPHGVRGKLEAEAGKAPGEAGRLRVGCYSGQGEVDLGAD